MLARLYHWYRARKELKVALNNLIAAAERFVPSIQMMSSPDAAAVKYAEAKKKLREL